MMFHLGKDACMFACVQMLTSLPLYTYMFTNVCICICLWICICVLQYRYESTCNVIEM